MSIFNFLKKLAHDIWLVEEDILFYDGHHWHRRKKHKKTFFELTSLTINNIKIEGNIMSVTMKKTQQAKGTWAPFTLADDGITKVLGAYQPGSVTYSSSDETLFTVVKDADNELVCNVIGVGDGNGKVTISALSPDGLTSISSSDDVIIADEPPPPPPTPVATGFTAVWDAPTDQTPA